MIKKILCLLLIIFLTFSLIGCWNYRGLNDLSIVSGLAIDKDQKSGNIKITLEVFDLASSADKESGGEKKSKLIESQGKTIFDANRNAKKRMSQRPYYGNIQVVIISEEIAKTDGINAIIDWFLRDAELRETVDFIISQEKTASDLLETSEINKTVVSSDIQKILVDDNKATSSTRHIEAYNIFNVLSTPGISLTIPAMRNVKNKEKQLVESSGTAVFLKDKLIGYLSAEESKYFLFVIDRIEGGIFTLGYNENDKDNISLEIKNNETTLSHTGSGKKLKFTVNTETDVYIGEITTPDLNLLQEKEINKIKNQAEKKLQNEIYKLIKKAQNEYSSDIFGFGKSIYMKHPDNWDELKDNWDDEIFKNLEIDVKCNFHIINTGHRKMT